MTSVRWEQRPSEVAIHEVLDPLLASRSRLWIESLAEHLVCEVGQREFAALDPTAETAVPIPVAPLDRVAQLAPFEKLRCHDEGAGEDVDAADVGVEEVGAIDALPAQACVEVEAAAADASGAQNLVDREA